MEGITLERFERLEEKVDKILSIVSAIDSNTTPCEEKQKASKATMDMVLNIMEQTPLKDNPMLKGLLNSMNPLVNGGVKK